MVRFIDAHRGTYEVEPICRVVGIAPSTCSEQQARTRDPARLPARAQRDAALRPESTRVWEATRRRSGAKNVWKELRRDDRALEGPLVHHSDSGSQYLAIRYTDRLLWHRVVRREPRRCLRQ